MSKAVVSSKFQIVIPKDVRENIGLKVGTTMEIITYGNRIELVPIDSIKKLKGLLKGIDTAFEREGDRL